MLSSCSRLGYIYGVSVDLECPLCCVARILAESSYSIQSLGKLEWVQPVGISLAALCGSNFGWREDLCVSFVDRIVVVLLS